MKTKQITKEGIYWEEYEKFLKMIDTKTLIQFIRLKEFRRQWIEEIGL